MGMLKIITGIVWQVDHQMQSKSKCLQGAFD